MSYAIHSNGFKASILPKGLALGCSRFGSIIEGTNDVNASRLIETALELDITHFDTADIYGQGDSERMLGRQLRYVRSRVTIASKVGQQFPLLQRVFWPLKGLLAPLLTFKAKNKESLSNLRSRRLPRSYKPDYLKRAVQASLRRLDLDYIDVMYLHSPSSVDLKDGAAVDTLSGLREAGSIIHIGVSCDDLEVAWQALKDPRVSVLQLPYLKGLQGWHELMCRAQQQNVLIVIRSIFESSSSMMSKSDRRAIVTSATQDPLINSVLIRTSKPENLRQLASWLGDA